MIRYDKATNLLHVGERMYPVKRWYSENGPGSNVRQAVLLFENRWGLSIIWGSMTYGDNYKHHGYIKGVWEETQPFVEEPHEVEVGVFLPEPRLLPGMSPGTVELMRQSGTRVSDEAAESMIRDRVTDLACDPFGWMNADMVNELADYVMTLPSHPTDVESIGRELEDHQYQKGTTT